MEKTYWVFKNETKIEITRENMLNLVCQQWNDMTENNLDEKGYSDCIIEYDGTSRGDKEDVEYDFIYRLCFACDYLSRVALVEDEDMCKRCPFLIYDLEYDEDSEVPCQNITSPYYEYYMRFESPDNVVTKEAKLAICQLFIDAE